MPKPLLPNSRRSCALEHLGHAEAEISKAISLLGGFTKARVPKKDYGTFIARKMIEGILVRLTAAINLLLYGHDLSQEGVKAVLRPQVELDPARPVSFSPLHAAPYGVPLLDSFERDYDLNRRPEC